MAYNTSPLYTNNSHMLTPEPNSQVHQLRPRTLSTSTSRSCITFLFKFLIFAVFLIIIALFPSQAPQFVNQTILDKFWELFHLLFVGIAVSYGLFSCRTVADVNTVHDDDCQSFESRMDDALSLFEDGHETPCWYSEKKMSHCWDADFKNESLNSRKSTFQDECHSWSSQYLSGESVVVVAQGNSCPEDLAHKPLGLPIRSLRFTSDSNGSEVGGVIKEFEGMRNTSRTFFVDEKELTNVEEKIDECDNRRSNFGYESLGLPVRKLTSSTRSNDSYEVTSGGESSSSRKSYSSSFSNGKKENLGQMGVLNPEEDLSRCDSRNSAFGCESLRLPVHGLRGTDSPRHSSGHSESGVSLGYSSMSSERSKDGDLSELDLEQVQSDDSIPYSSPLPRQLRSGRYRELRGEDRDFVGPHSHFRPLSVDESQFESFKSQSLGSLPSDSSQGSSISFPPTKQSCFSSISTEVPDLKMKGGRRTQRLPESSVNSPIPSKQVNGEELGKRTSFRRRYTWASRYRIDSFDGDAPSSAANFQGQSKNKALCNANVEKKVDHDLKDLDSSQDGHSFGNREQYMDFSLNPYANLDEAYLDSPSAAEHVNNEALFRQRTFYSSPAVSSPASKPSKNKIFAPTTSRSIRGAKLGEDLHKSFKDDPEDSSRIPEEDSMTKKDQYMDSLSYAKAPSLSRASLRRAKSVRTRRSNIYMAEANNTDGPSENRIDNMAGKVHSGIQDIHPGPGEKGPTTGVVENQIPVVKQASRDHDIAKQKPTQKYILESEDEMEIEVASIRASSEGKGRVSHIGNAGEDYSSEVDKKAGEFIAKFREQIRLQKMSSIGDSGELRMGGN